MSDIEDTPKCPECDCDMEGDDDDELHCSNPRPCNAQVDRSERLFRSPPPGRSRRHTKRLGRPKVITEAYIVDLIRRGKYKDFRRRLRNKRR